MPSCIFCQIAQGTVPSMKIYEDESAVAFLDIMPVTKGHCLLIPKQHIENIYDMPPDVAAAVFSAAPKIANALQAAFEPAGLNVLNNNGAPAGQSVFHSHIHFIPRYGSEDGFRMAWQTKEADYAQGEIEELAKLVRSHL